MKSCYIFIVICSALLLQGCLGAAVISSAAIATNSITDPRSVGRQVDDKTLEIRVTAAINKDQKMSRNTRIITTAYGGKILLIGQAPDQVLVHKAKHIAMKVAGVELVYNEIRHANPINFGVMYKDAWITAKIKSQIFVSDLVKSSAIKVLTENCEVFLLGMLTKKEGAIVSRMASEINGVTRVTTIFTYLD